ncbi:hypothetical protein [Hymenobacter pini]|uniref:hypothetical protein n=1 Tax=Hymenobacter pini TaxID=2880879 RepID=UPI001CF31FA4|nr:hypothetical protein [Hymenobacter pini]MCA8833381.1 hypothetical protein [Hymenobacter pini]
MRFNRRLRLLRMWRPAEPTAAQVPVILEAILAGIERHQARQLLLNMHRLPPLDPAVQQWLYTNWLPRLRRSGITRLAVLLPMELHNRMMTEGLLLASTRASLPYEVQYFTELPAALEWLFDAERLTNEHDWPWRWRTPALARRRQRRRTS